MDRKRVESAVLEVVARLAGDLDYPRERVALDSSLVDDIGVDSLTFVELTLQLEEVLGMPEFPMQEWADKQLELEAPHRFLVADLVDQCVRLLAEQRDD